MIRGVGAALTAAVLALSGCASSSGEEATTAQTPDAPVNPWELPREERPDLFDPCAEIPIEAIEEGVGSLVQPAEEFDNYRPGDLISCGWTTDELIITGAASWKSRDEFIQDEAITTIDSDSESTGRRTVRIRDGADGSDRSCSHVFFTTSGAVVFGIDQTSSLRSHKGENFAESCEVLDEVIVPVLETFPKGDF